MRYHTSLQQLYHTAAAIVKVGFGIFFVFDIQALDAAQGLCLVGRCAAFVVKHTPCIQIWKHGVVLIDAKFLLHLCNRIFERIARQHFVEKSCLQDCRGNDGDDLAEAVGHDAADQGYRRLNSNDCCAPEQQGLVHGFPCLQGMAEGFPNGARMYERGEKRVQGKREQEQGCEGWDGDKKQAEG